MYQVYIKTDTGLDKKRLIGEFRDYEKACEKIEAELAKNKDLRYVIEETTGAVDVYGNLIVDVVDEN